MARKSTKVRMNLDAVESRFDRTIQDLSDRILLLLKRAGEEFVKEARMKGNYRDHTGNLRSSIGYAIIMDGELSVSNVRKSGTGTDQSTGTEEANRLIKELSSVYDQGCVLIGFAGMRYAVYVEAIHNLDVISGASIRTEDFIRRTSAKLLRNLSYK